RHTRFSRDWSSDVCSSDLGSSPSPLQGVLYTGPLAIVETVQLRAVATKGGMADSLVSELDVILPVGTSTVLEAEDLPVFGNGARSEERRVGNRGEVSVGEA